MGGGCVALGLGACLGSRFVEVPQRRNASDLVSVGTLAHSVGSVHPLAPVTMLRALLIAVFAAFSEAFMLTGARMKPNLAPATRAASPAMMAPETTSALATLPSMLVAEDSTLLFASGTIISAIFLFAVVGTVVINFGIRRK